MNFKEICSYFVIVLLLISTASALDIAKYEIGEWSEQANCGNHRAKIRIHDPTEAVAVSIPWRRRDVDAEGKAIYVFTADGKRVKNVISVSITPDEGKLIFQPYAGTEEYYIYYMPYKRVGAFESESYEKAVDTADIVWLKKQRLVELSNRISRFKELPKAQVLSLQARSQFNSFYPMEVCAVADEVDLLKKKYMDRQFLTFPESRELDIRMTDRIPYRWFKFGPAVEYEAKARPNELFVFQIGVWAHGKQIQNLSVEFTDLQNASGKRIPAKNLTCFNTSGIDIKGEQFHRKLTIDHNMVQPLWVGVTVPEDANGFYSGSIRLIGDKLPAVIFKLKLDVSGAILKDYGLGDINRLSRLFWLNSRIGLNDDVLPGFAPIGVKNNAMYIGGRTIILASDGLPESIKSNDVEILARPVSLIGKYRKQNIRLSGSVSQLTKQQKTVVQHNTSGLLGDVPAQISSTFESDGCLEYFITLKPERDMQLDDLWLEIPIRKSVAKYITGMRQRGGLRRNDVFWKWGNNNLTSSVWIGEVNAGIQLKLQEPNATWTMWGDAITPNAWYNKGRGGCNVIEQDDIVLVKAYCGATTLQANKPLLLRFRFLITPFKEIDKRRWDWRTRATNFKTDGNNIVHIHQGMRSVTPHINYPFTHIKELKDYIQKAKKNYPPVTLTYPLKGKFSPQGGTLHIKTMLNFNFRDREKDNNAYNHQLAKINLGEDNGILGLYWNTNDCGIRGYFKKVTSSGKQTFPKLLFGKMDQTQIGETQIISLSWGKKLSTYVNGRLISQCDWSPYAKSLKTKEPILELSCPRYIISAVKIEAQEYSGGTVDFSSNSDSVLLDIFREPSKIKLPKSGTITLETIVDFDSTEYKKTDSRYNRSLLQLNYSKKDKVDFYWSVADHGMCVSVQTGSNLSKHPIVVSSTSSNWQRGNRKTLSFSWGDSLKIGVDGKVISSKPHKGLLTGTTGPVALRIMNDGFVVKKISISSPEPGFKPIEYLCEDVPNGSTTPGGGTFTKSAIKSWNGIFFGNDTFNPKFQLYYTIRELSNHCREIWAFRSLKPEIYSCASVVYADNVFFANKDKGGYPWLQEHLVKDYAPGWRTTSLKEEVDAAVGTKPDSRLINFYLEGLKYIMDETNINGLYLDGIGYGRDVMKRVAQIMNKTMPNNYRIEFHCSDLYSLSGVSVINSNLEHLPYLSNLWLGENFDYDMPPDFYLIEMSGIPFGIMGEMLNYSTGAKRGGNPYRGMVFGMGGRFLPCRKALWEFWDRFNFKDAEMIGYWDEKSPIKISNPDIFATIYRKKGKTLIALAHWTPMLVGSRTPRTAVIPKLKTTAEIKKLGAKLTALGNPSSFSLLLPKRQTVAYVSAMEHGLLFHLQANCEKFIEAKHKERDGKIWHDDSVELFIQPNLNSRSYYQIIINNINGIYDARIDEEGRLSPSWNGFFQSNTFRTANGWETNIFIPYSELKMKPLHKGDKIGFNFARNGNDGASVWSYTGRSFHNVERFAVLTVGTNPTRQTLPDFTSLIKPLEPFTMKIDYTALGLSPEKVKIIAPEIDKFQPFRQFNINEPIPIERNKGWLLLLEQID